MFSFQKVVQLVLLSSSTSLLPLHTTLPVLLLSYIPYIPPIQSALVFAAILNEKNVSPRFQSAPFLQPPLAYKAD